MDALYFDGDSIIHRLDPRVRLVAALALSVVLATGDRTAALVVGFALAAAVTLAARPPARALARRMAAVNAFMAMLWLLLPLAATGPAAIHAGPLALSRDGLRQAALITLKVNAVVLTLSALVSTIEPVSLGHAMRHLRVPARLVHLLLMTIRYIDLLRRQYGRLRQAMLVRGFRPGVNAHTYRTAGYLVGMLLVTSYDRSLRVLAAMKCRGWHGEFFAFDHFVLKGRDVVFAVAALVATALLGWAQWT